MSHQRQPLSPPPGGGNLIRHSKMPTIVLPEALKKEVPSLGAKLHVGTFSLTGTHQFNPYGNQNGMREEYLILFRPYRNGEPGGDVHQSVGTMNISVLGQSNQIVLVTVEVPKPKNLFEEYLGFAMKKDEGGSRVVGCWMPDGASGRFMFEQDQFFVQLWLTSARSAAMNIVKLIGMVILIGIIGTILPCLFWLFMPFAGFVYYKYVQKRRSQGKVTSMDEYKMAMHSWMTELIETGAIQRAYLEGFGIATDSQGERL